MPIITLTTDLGDSDYYVGAVKGYILSHCPPATIVDISNKVRPFDVGHAAFLLRNAFREFPIGTTHLAHVQSGRDAPDRNVLVVYDQHYFIGPDNGLFSMVVEPPVEVYALKPRKPRSTFPTRDNLAPVACDLLNGINPAEIGMRQENLVELAMLRPAISPDGIRCNVIHTDHFGNVVLNLTRKRFEEARQDRNFAVNLKGNNTIEALADTYSDVHQGEALCLFNSAGYMELAVNSGHAANLFGLAIGDSIRIDFI